MPVRLIREGILTSKRVQRLVELGGWEAEVFYRRLMSIVDDFGRYEADPVLLRTALFARCLDKMRDSNVSRCLRYCQEAGLVRIYSIGDDQYLEMQDFRQRTRAEASKYPDPPTDDGHTSVKRTTLSSLDGDGDGDGDGDVSTSGTAGRKRSKVDDFVEALWSISPPKARQRSSRASVGKAAKALGKDLPPADVAVPALMAWKACDDWQRDGGQYIPGLHRWVKERRWEDLPESPNPLGTEDADEDDPIFNLGGDDD